MNTKRIEKDDGRYLIFYSFAETRSATESSEASSDRPDVTVKAADSKAEG